MLAFNLFAVFAFCVIGAAGNKRRKDGDSRKSSVVEGRWRHLMVYFSALYLEYLINAVVLGDFFELRWLII